MLTVELVSAAKFTWVGARGTAEASELPNGLVRRVYVDAADVGFMVHGRSGKKLFTLESETRQDGDLVCSRFVSADGFSIVIFND